MIKGVSTKYIFFILCSYLLLFQNLLQTYIPFVQYFDEILSLLAIPIVFIKLMKNNNKFIIKKYNLYIITLFIIVVLVGLFSSLKYMYQPLAIVLSDLLLVSKFFLTYMLSEILFDTCFIDKYKDKIGYHVKLNIIVLFILTLLNYVFKIWPQNSYRFGIMSNELFYEHPTYLAAACIFLLVLLLMSLGITNQKKFILLILLILLSTLRIKAIGMAIVAILLIYYIDKKNKKISISKIGLIAIIILIISWNQISFYYIDIDGSARKKLNEVSVEIANDYFPLGSGFGTYASHFSMTSYSPIYELYGINNIYGLQKSGNVSYVSDTFWPMVIGQFGWIGVISYIGILFVIFKKTQDEFSEREKNVYVSKIICFMYLIISSTSEATFVNSISIPLAIIIGINNFNERKE